MRHQNKFAVHIRQFPSRHGGYRGILCCVRNVDIVKAMPNCGDHAAPGSVIRHYARNSQQD
jgi:hypothetical protein